MIRRWITIRLSSFLIFALLLFTFHVPAASSRPLFYPEEEGRRAGFSQQETAPRLILPDLQVFPPYDLRLILDSETGRALLRFSNSIWNAGPGDLELRGIPNWLTGEITVTQSILSEDGRLLEKMIGQFVFHPDHQHWHLDGFGGYEVWSLTPSGGLQSRLSSSGKVSYCVMDSDLKDPQVSGFESIPQKYTACGWSLQGISRGWVDTYQSSVAGQWIEITGLSDGSYALVSWVDSVNAIVEANESNNRAVTFFQYSGRRIIRSGSVLSAVGIVPEHHVPYE